MQCAGNNKIVEISYYRVIPVNKLTYDHLNHRNYSGIIERLLNLFSYTY